MITQPSRAPLGSVLAQLGRVLAAASAASPSAIPSYDPVFLPDCVSLAPDQVQELRYGIGRVL